MPMQLSSEQKFVPGANVTVTELLKPAIAEGERNHAAKKQLADARQTGAYRYEIMLELFKATGRQR